MLKRRNSQSIRAGKTSTARRERGLQLIEAAFVMPIMILLLATIAEFGRYFHMRSTMLRATMTGAVYMSDKSNTAAEVQNAQRMAICGQTTPCNDATKLVYTGLSEASISVVVSPINPITGRFVTVSTNNVRYAPVFMLSSMASNPTGGQWWNIPINVQTRMRYTGS